MDCRSKCWPSRPLRHLQKGSKVQAAGFGIKGLGGLGFRACKVWWPEVEGMQYKRKPLHWKMRSAVRRTLLELFSEHEESACHYTSVISRES